MAREKPKRRAVFIFLLIALSIVAFMLFINSRTAKKSTHVVEGRRKLVVTGEVEAMSKSSSLVYCAKDLLIEAEGENVRAKNVSGNIIWSQKLPRNIVRMADTGQNIAIIDSSNNTYYFSLQGKMLWTHKSDYNIIDVFSDPNGSILLEYRGITGSHAEIFAADGSKIGYILVEDSHILSFSAGDDVFFISVLDTSSDTIKTKIISYNLKGDILWAHNFDKTVISGLIYGKDSKLIAIGENSIYLYKDDGSLQQEIKIEGKVTNISGNRYLIAAALSNKGKQYATCYDSSLREQGNFELKGSPMGIFPFKNSFIIYYNDELMVIQKGELIARHKSNIDIARAYMTPDNKIYIVSNRKLQQLEYEK